MKSGLKRLLLVSALLATVCASPLQAQNSTVSSDEIAKLREEIQRLKAENQQLKAENQQLRQMLVQPVAQATDTRPVQSSKPAATETQVKPVDSQETGYWITTSSGKRHNKNCRYYKNSNGRFGRLDEGTACKICGG